jgi:N-methylhydantoinase A
VPLLLVHSGGGSIGMAEAKRRPLTLAASGPAAGVAACVAVAKAAGVSDIVTCDLGGTSFDVSVIVDGEPARRTRGNLMGMWTALPLIDVESIGSGGGSLGWIDARGMLRVGPRSAGSVPGPACYVRGGRQATVTDALVVLGYIDPDNFLGGDFKLDADAAQAACADLGDKLGMGAEETAWGIRRLALAGMVKATRQRTGMLAGSARAGDRQLRRLGFIIRAGYRCYGRRAEGAGARTGFGTFRLRRGDDRHSPRTYPIGDGECPARPRAN